MKKNDKKVILGILGEFEVYVYPYDFPDKVFIGRFPVSTMIEAANVNQLISAFNKARNYLEGNYFSKPKKSKAANSRRQSIQTAYKRGLEAMKAKKKASLH